MIPLERELAWDLLGILPFSDGRSHGEPSEGSRSIFLELQQLKGQSCRLRATLENLRLTSFRFEIFSFERLHELLN